MHYGSEAQMGEAKRRGTYEQRRADGEARLAEEQRQRKTLLEKREAAMTPEVRVMRRRALLLFAQIAASGMAGCR